MKYTKEVKPPLFKIGKLYQNISKENAFPLYSSIEDELNKNLYVMRCWLDTNNIFVPILFIPKLEYIAYKILCEDGVLRYVILSKFIDDLEEMFCEVSA